MEENPYDGLLGMMQLEGARLNPPSICIGEVVTTNPLSIKVDELLLEQENILIADFLLDGYKRSFHVTSNGTINNTGTTTIQGDLVSETQNESGGSGDSAFASHKHMISNSATLSGTNEANGQYNLEGDSDVEFKSYLKKGDLMALMPAYGEQIYIVLCKVVSLA